MPAAEGALSRIAVLPPAVADAIAAGEVVERPAAVVKELVENALDSGATRIAIRVEDAGRALIEVVDDGGGIIPEDAALAFRRHATSKIETLDDLRAVTTLGFRGEALASIAAVAEVELATRVRGRGEGRRVLVRGGVVEHDGAAGTPDGTRVSVRQLFFNTPARFRFLKQPTTETAVIVRVAGELALGHPETAFVLQVDGRQVLRTPGTGDLRDAFAAIAGTDAAAAMLPVDDGPVHGLLSPPSLTRSTRDHVVILVNRRRIHHRNLAFAVEQSYQGLKDPDRYPLAVLNLQVDPLEIDINVHPTKREIRFRDERRAFAAIERACFRALRQSPLYQLEAASEGAALQLRETTVISGPAWTPSAVAPEPPRPSLPPLTYVGQVLDAYLVAQAPDALVLIDQHAAHERVLFDGIWERLRQGSAATQPLLLARVVDVTPEQAASAEQHRVWLSQLGFEVEVFGERALRLRAAPAELKDGRAEPALVRLLDDLARDVSPEVRQREAAALLACHGAVRFGDPLTDDTAGALLRQLAETAEPITCPHGRPTTLLLSDPQLRRLFRRP
jgi:DNA mismatch repair protein MutL